LLRVNPLMSAVYGLISVNCVIGYIVTFQLAYKVTEKSQELLHTIKIPHANGNGNGNVVGLLKWTNQDRIRGNYREMIVRSIRPMAIFVGSLHTVERESVPIFVDFVVQQIIALLLEF
jgi:hypothetical protein